MANIKSSKKRILIAERNAAKNVAFKSSIKTAIKKALELGAGEDKDALNQAVSKVYQLCDKRFLKASCTKTLHLEKNQDFLLP